MFFTSFLLCSMEATPVPVSLIRQEGFDEAAPIRAPRATSQFFDQYADFKNTAGESISITLRWVSSKEQKRLYSHLEGEARDRHMDSIAAAKPFLHHLPSSMPPKTARVHKGVGVSASILTDTAFVTCHYTPRIGSTAKGYMDPEPFDFQTKSALVERVARHTLANAAGLRLDDAGVGALAGRSITKAKCRWSNRVFGRVDEWTEGEGWSFAEDRFYGIINLKKGSKWAVLPLGADQIKVNGVWKEMGDSAAFLNGKLYLPEAGLKHLKDAD